MGYRCKTFYLAAKLLFCKALKGLVTGYRFTPQPANFGLRAMRLRVTGGTYPLAHYLTCNPVTL